MFDFTVRHVPGKKNAVADALSRKDNGPIPHEAEDLDDWVDGQLEAVHLHVRPMQAGNDLDGVAPDEEAAISEREGVLDESYSADSQRIARWLLTFRRPQDLTKSEFRTFKKQALKFVVRDGHLFRKRSKNVPLVRVVDGKADRNQIILQLHDEGGHRGREGTYRRLADRYYWYGMFSDVSNYIKTCEACQMRAPGREEEALHPSWTPTLDRKWAIDIVKMPHVDGSVCMVLAREEVSGWPEGRALRNAESRTVAKFLYEDVICRHGPMEYLVNDGGPENKQWTEILMEVYGIKNVRISAYHPQANGMVERGHAPIVNALSKLAVDTGRPWTRNLHTALWADRTTTKVTTGMTPAYIKYGQDPVLPIELLFPTWKTTRWTRL